MDIIRCDNMIERICFSCSGRDFSCFPIVKILEHYSFLLVFFALGAGGLRDIRVNVPEAVASGSTVTLNCRYDLETDTLYSVKWYKGRQEFFRYIPKELPHTRVFPLPGVNVDVGRSGPLTVVLRAVTPFLSGRYRCEVSADAPSFHTAMKTSYMHVVDVPEGAPDLVAERNRVAPGDILRAHCTSPPAKPIANITWLLNGQIINGTSFKSLAVDEESHKWPTNIHNGRNFIPMFNKTSNEDLIAYEIPSWSDRKSINAIINSADEHSNTENHNVRTSRSREVNPLDQSTGYSEVEMQTKRRSTSSLSLAVSQDTLRDGALRLTCKVSIYSLYNAQVELLLTAEKPQIASVLVLATGHTHSCALRVTYSNFIWIFVTVFSSMKR